jgi:hypothetical protein
MSEELRMAYDTIRNSEFDAQQMLRGKEDEVICLTNKMNELDIIISKYGQNLTNIKKSYDKMNSDHQIDMLKKSTELKQVRDTYESRIRELQSKIEEILLKENAFSQKINIRSDNTLNSVNSVNPVNNFHNVNNVNSALSSMNLYNLNRKVEVKTHNPYTYVPREIPDDEEVRRKINEQINYIKEKLDRSYLEYN